MPNGAADQGAARLRRQGRGRHGRRWSKPATPRASASCTARPSPARARWICCRRSCWTRRSPAMPIPKPMRWGAHAYGFARPLHWLVLLLGNDVVDRRSAGHPRRPHQRGHRFHAPASRVPSRSRSDYVAALLDAKVLVDPDARRARIVDEVRARGAGRRRHRPHRRRQPGAGELPRSNGRWRWPARFEREFLAVPQEALVETMEANQKFFPVLDAQRPADRALHRHRQHRVARTRPKSARATSG